MKRPHSDNDESSKDKTSPNTGRNFRLLLHGVDGTIPYLTPLTLESLFPPSSEENDDLWIGLAAKDSCVVPHYYDGNDDKNNTKKNKNKKNNQKNQTSNGSSKNNNNEGNKKPRGYTFSNVPVDPWLLPYTRVTVPTFDLLYDNEMKQKRQQQQQQKQQKQKRQQQEKVVRENDIGSTNNHILLWTPHGRQKLTSDLYAKASYGLNSKYTVSMFDMNDADSGFNDDVKKRKEKADMRNKLWYEDLYQRWNNNEEDKEVKQEEKSSSLVSSSSVWMPVLLPTSKENQNDDTDGSNITVTIPAYIAKDTAGIALIGRWNENMKIVFPDKKEDTTYNSNLHTAILSTSSLMEILNVATSGMINIIGTDLPTQWAKTMHAMVLHLYDDDDENDDEKVNSSPSKKKVATEKHDKTNDDTHTHASLLDADGCIDMHDIKYKHDTRPLKDDCTCIACKDNRFSRSYIHHLVCAKEILAEIILFIHNLHQLRQLIRRLNTSSDIQHLVNYYKSQLGSSLKKEEG